MYKVRYIGDPFLRRQSGQITQFDTNLEKLIYDMTDAMHREDGIGLAAPQIGIDKRIVVIDISSIEKDEKPRAFLNPEIIKSSGESTVEEGCLSIPGVREDVTRPEHIQLTYQNAEGELFKDEYDGWLARVLQHEIDHLDGILFVDHITPLKRQMLVQQGAIPETY